MKYCFFGILITGVLLGFTYQNTYRQIGNASYYSNKFQGRRTASGAPYHKDSMYCAHKSLKYGTLLKVTNLKNDSTIIVKVMDRMGSRSPHIIDLSMAGAQKLNFVQNGIAKVQIEEYIPVAKAD